MTTNERIKIMKRADCFNFDKYIHIDVTQKAGQEWKSKFSPFYPHGNIPVPGMQGRVSSSVEGIWEGLKVFKYQGVDYEKFNETTWYKMERTGDINKYFDSEHYRAFPRADVVETMQYYYNKKRNTNLGSVLGHQYEGKLLGYVEARKKIFVPAYNYVLTHYLKDELERLRNMIKRGGSIAFYDFGTNEDINDTSSRFSHAALIKKHLLETMDLTMFPEKKKGPIKHLATGRVLFD